MKPSIVALSLMLGGWPHGVPLPAVRAPTALRAPAELRVPASTAYFAPDPEGTRVARGRDRAHDRDVAPFATAGSSLRWYGAFARTGSVTAQVELSVPKGDTITLRLAVSGESRDTTRATPLTRLVGSDSTVRVSLGVVEITSPGYTRFELSAPGRRGAPRVRVAALVLDGAPMTDAHFNLDPRRNAASVHLRYPVDSSAVITGFYNEVVAVEDPVTTYYMATGFARGYFGMQVNSPTERRIIFSVWDAGDGGTANDRSTVRADDQTQLLGKGEGVVAEVFGNEGTGGHSHLVYDWKTGSTQRFFVTATLDGTHTIYSGYWFHPDRRQWQLIASFRAPKDGQGLRRLYSFSENFEGATGHLMRKALFGPSWIRLANGEWKELTTATFSHDATGKSNRLDRFMGVEGNRFFLQHGGFVSGFTTSGSAFTRTPSGAPPRIELPNLPH